MKGTLRLKSDEWVLEDSDGSEVDNGDYPLYEDDMFIEEAAETLGHWKYHNKPYEKVDERD